jgi:hypothetical protein
MKNEELEQLIERSFSAEPDFHLPSDFAKQVTHIISRRKHSKTVLREYIYLAVISLSFLAVVSAIYYITDHELLLKSFTFIKENMLPVVSIVIILNFILFADRILLPFLFSRWNKT